MVRGEGRGSVGGRTPSARHAHTPDPTHPHPLRFVETGRVDGWDDPRFPTVRGVLRRGLTVPALRDFILSQGASRNVTLQDFDRLWATNKAAIDPACPRHSAVREAGAVLLTLADGPEVPEVVQLPRHKKNPELGTKVGWRSGGGLEGGGAWCVRSRDSGVRMCGRVLGRAGRHHPPQTPAPLHTQPRPLNPFCSLSTAPSGCGWMPLTRRRCGRGRR